MDIDIHIDSEAGAVALLSTNKFDLTVTIDAPHSMLEQMHRARTVGLAEAASRRVLVQTYEDTDSRLHLDGPYMSDINALVESARELQAGARVLCHCKAGVSRSPAAAIIILCTRGMSLEDATAHVLKIRPQARPNVVMLDLFAQLNHT